MIVRVNGQVQPLVAIDPGINGAIVMTDGNRLEVWAMPLVVEGKERRSDFEGVHNILIQVVKRRGHIPVYLERAVPFAMGTKSAFSYGRGFEALVIAVQTVQMPLTLVEPGKWAKVMHEGISGDLKPKVKSQIAVKRLYPHLLAQLPTNSKGAFADGPVDALLIAGYALRKSGVSSNVEGFF